MNIEQKKLLLSFLRRIPPGRVMTYHDLAHRFHIHPRTVATLLSQNSEQDIFPCYKVIHADGRVGGYNLGPEEKIRRLQKDGVEIINGCIDEKYVWIPEADNAHSSRKENSSQKLNL